MSNPVRIHGSVSRITSHGDGVFTMHLKSDGVLPRFKPGQFLHLAVDDFDPAGGFWPESRVFSIARKQGDDELVIAYSVKGSFTRRMRDELAVGSRVWLKMPYGDFVVDRHAPGGAPVALVAGGTGMTAFIAFLSRELEAASSRHIALYYGVRRAELILFADVMAEARRRLPNFRLRLFVEDNAAQAGLDAEKGRPLPAMVREETADAGDCTYFIAGPPQMVEFFLKELNRLGVAGKRMIVDDWE